MIEMIMIAVSAVVLMRVLWMILTVCMIIGKGGDDVEVMEDE